ncbi:MAG: hypothetical protein R3Y32_03085 [Bacillota bacterium]
MEKNKLKEEINEISEFGSIILTRTQIDNILKNDMGSITKFYYDNINIFTAMACAYNQKMQCCNVYRYDVDSMLQQLFIDIPLLKYSTRKSLICSVRSSFFWSCFSGLSNRYENYKIDSLTSSLYTFSNKKDEYEEYERIDLPTINSTEDDYFLEIKNQGLVKELEYKLRKIFVNDKDYILATLMFIDGYSQSRAKEILKEYFNG